MFPVHGRVALIFTAFTCTEADIVYSSNWHDLARGEVIPIPLLKK